MAAIPHLTTRRLIVTLPPPASAPRFAHYVRDNLAHFKPWSPTLRPEMLSEEYWCSHLERARADLHEGKAAHLFLLRRDDPDGAIVGQCSFSEIVRGAFHAAYLGYRIAGAAEGKGLMREALETAIPWAFREMALHRIMANYRPSNERSGRLLRSLGFTVEGYARDYLFIDGVWCDHILTSLTDPGFKPPA